MQKKFTNYKIISVISIILVWISFFIFQQFQNKKNIEKHQKQIKKQIQKDTINFKLDKIFDENNWFRTDIIINFSKDFYNEKNQNKILAEKKLYKLLQITPKTDFRFDDIVFVSPKKAIINLSLWEAKEYEIKIKSFWNFKWNIFNFETWNLSFLEKSQKKLEKKENIFIENINPLFYRKWDQIELLAKVFNNTQKKIWLKIKFESKELQVKKSEKNIFLEPNSSEKIHFWSSWSIDKTKDLNYNILAIWENSKILYKLSKKINYKNFPLSNKIIYKWDLAELQKIQHFKVDIPENTELLKSKVYLSFSNNILGQIENIIKSSKKDIYWNINQLLYNAYYNAILSKNFYLFSNIKTKQEIKKDLENSIQKIFSMQQKSWWFSSWQWEKNANLLSTINVVDKLIDIKNLQIKILEDKFQKSIKYLENNSSNLKNNLEKTKIFYIFSKLKKQDFINKKSLDKIDVSKLNNKELIFYTYWLVFLDSQKYKKNIEENIKKILKNISKNKIEQKALFVSMLIDYWYDKKIITENIKELYKQNYYNFYVSYITKINVLNSFIKYYNKFETNAISNFAFSIGYIQNRNKRFWLWWRYWNIFERNFVLDDIIQYKENFLELTTYVLSGNSIFSNLVINLVPKDNLKIKEVSNKMKVFRKIYDLASWKEIVDWNFEKWKLYEIKFNIKFDENKCRKNLVLQDYIPGSFSIINSRYKTQKNKVNKWEWNYIKYFDDKIFAITNYFCWDELNFDYIAKANFRGKYIYAPVNVYINNKTNYYSKFEEINVK